MYIIIWNICGITTLGFPQRKKKRVMIVSKKSSPLLGLKQKFSLTLLFLFAAKPIRPGHYPASSPTAIHAIRGGGAYYQNMK